MAGATVEFNGWLDVGGFRARRPLDNTLPASEVVRCRCTMVYREFKADKF